MRPGDKLESYSMLAAALDRIEHLGWTIAIVGDGPCRQEVVSQFARLDPARIEWLGERPPSEMPQLYASGALYAWPGFGEAYGLAYLEAQAAGLPVVAQDIEGVPGVVRNGSTGILTPPRDAAAFADAIARLLDDAALRRSMSQAARSFVFEERSLETATARLGSILQGVEAMRRWLTTPSGNRLSANCSGGGKPDVPPICGCATTTPSNRPPRSIACSRSPAGIRSR